MRPRRRDPTFLYMAILAGSGGLLAIVASIGMPLWMDAHGHHVSPAIMLLACWGIFALLGAVACVQTYLLSDPTDRPPRGGVHLTVIDGGQAPPPQPEELAA
jgi:hypothetical protein